MIKYNFVKSILIDPLFLESHFNTPDIDQVCEETKCIHFKIEKNKAYFYFETDCKHEEYQLIDAIYKGCLNNANLKFFKGVIPKSFSIKFDKVISNEDKKSAESVEEMKEKTSFTSLDLNILNALET